MTRQERSRKIKKLDKLFSEYIRKRDGCCLWCGSTSSLQCSHIIGRASLKFRWDPFNAITLCYACHMFKWHKQPLEAARWLSEKYPNFYAKWQQNRSVLPGGILDLESIEKSLQGHLNNTQLDL